MVRFHFPPAREKTRNQCGRRQCQVGEYACEHDYEGNHKQEEISILTPTTTMMVCHNALPGFMAVSTNSPRALSVHGYGV